jgi:Mg-chelatase subunit ChlD
MLTLRAQVPQAIKMSMQQNQQQRPSGTGSGGSGSGSGGGGGSNSINNSNGNGNSVINNSNGSNSNNRNGTSSAGANMRASLSNIDLTQAASPLSGMPSSSSSSTAASSPEAAAPLMPIRTAIDFVVVIDRSSSMKLNNKLAFVKATIEFMVCELREWHRFCLIEFNQEAQRLMPLTEMTPDNKQLVLDRLHKIKADGNTNISAPLFLALDELRARDERHSARISSVLLFTDGLANNGSKGSKLLKQLLNIPLPSGLTIHTFGYGADHDSSTLQAIALASKGGVYHYIESPDVIAPTFGECLAGIMSTAAHSISVRVQGQDGCRIINFYTKFPVESREDVKDYSVSLGSIYADESKSLLMKLSLRKMSKPMLKHQLLRVTVK